MIYIMCWEIRAGGCGGVDSESIYIYLLRQQVIACSPVHRGSLISITNVTERKTAGIG